MASSSPLTWSAIPDAPRPIRSAALAITLCQQVPDAFAPGNKLNRPEHGISITESQVNAAGISRTEQAFFEHSIANEMTPPVEIVSREKAPQSAFALARVLRSLIPQFEPSSIVKQVHGINRIFLNY